MVQLNRYPSVNQLSKIKDLEVGLNNTRSTKKKTHFLSTHIVKKYIENFCEEDHTLPQALPSQQKMMSQSVVQPERKEAEGMKNPFMLDNSAGMIGGINYNPYTKEKIIIVNRSVDLRDHPSFDNMNPSTKSPTTLVDRENLNDSLLKAKQEQGYLSLPKILGLKSKARLKNTSVILNK